MTADWRDWTPADETQAINEGYAAADEEGFEIDNTENPYTEPRLREAWEGGHKNLYLQMDMWLYAALA